jgi:carotenoid cleavage dioxygenase-like enzyme
MTQKYVVFIRNPITMDLSDPSKPVAQILEVEEDTPTSFFVLDKEDGKL